MGHWDFCQDKPYNILFVTITLNSCTICPKGEKLKKKKRHFQLFCVTNKAFDWLGSVTKYYSPGIYGLRKMEEYFKFDSYLRRMLQKITHF